jgi:hypothetical protein
VGESRTRASRHEIFFVVLMLVFVTTLVIQSFDLSPSPRHLPQVVGFPTLVFLVIQLLRDLGYLTRVEARLATRRKPVPSVPAPEARLAGDMSVAELAEALDKKQREEGHDTDVVDDDARLRMAVFTAWALALVALSALTSFLLAVPVLLFALLYWSNRRPILSVVATVATSAVVWGTFDVFLGVRF